MEIKWNKGRERDVHSDVKRNREEGEKRVRERVSKRQCPSKDVQRPTPWRKVWMSARKCVRKWESVRAGVRAGVRVCVGRCRCGCKDMRKRAILNVFWHTHFLLFSLSPLFPPFLFFKKVSWILKQSKYHSLGEKEELGGREGGRKRERRRERE